MPDSKPDYNEFYNPRLVAIYNTVCPLDGYEKFYLELTQKISAKTIIDIGCGTGLLTCELAKHDHKMIGVEPSKLMLDVARRSKCGAQVKWIQSDAISLEEFDADLAIMTGHVAQFHLEDDYWFKILKSINKALRIGGYLAFESRNPTIQPWFKDKNQPDLYIPKLYRKVNDPVEGEIEVYTKLLEVRGNRTLGELQYHFNKTREVLTSHGEMIFRTREEITKFLEDAGFSIENVYGDWDWSIAKPDSPEFIFVAKKL